MTLGFSRFHGSVVFAACMAAVGSASAQSTSPTYDSFASLTSDQLAAITFGGTGIAEYGPVALSGNGSFWIALAATPRVSGSYTGPAVTNNGFGTYFAQTGESPASGSNNAAWNFDYAIVGNTTGLHFKLYADVDPGVGTPAGSYLDFSLLLGSGAFGGSSQSTQESINLGFYDGGSTYPFSPFVTGEYNLSLRAFDASNTLVDEAAIRVTVVPEPEAYGLAMAGLGVVGFAMGRRRKAAA